MPKEPTNLVPHGGFVTMVGRSNTGKSTLLNTLVGTKIAAVTHKPQTTRQILHGVINDPRGQAVLVDTPGVLKDKRDALGGKLLEKVHEALQEIDLILYIVDPTKAIGVEERYILSMLRKTEVPKILVINKSDLPDKEKTYLEDYKTLGEDGYAAVIELSAIKSRHIEPLKDKIFALLPEMPEPFYPQDQVTNISKEEWMAEVIREKILLALRQEVPYSASVKIESVEDKGDLMVIKAVVNTSDSRYKKMIIGAGGRAIKEIGIAARKELEGATNKKIYLELEVETDKHWQERV